MSLLSWFFGATPDPIDSLIKPPRQRFHGHDETKNTLSQTRRARAEMLRAEARRIELKQVEEHWYRKQIGIRR